MRNKNEYVLYKDFAELIINSDKFGKFVSKIDLDEVSYCKLSNWSIGKFTSRETNKEFYYVVNSRKGLLHRILINCPKGFRSDHINSDTMDNRKINLRIATSSQNNMNRGKQSNNTSGHIGVTWAKRFSKWMAYIGKNRVKINLGYYDKIEDAVEARRKGEIEFFGEFRKNE